MYRFSILPVAILCTAISYCQDPASNTGILYIGALETKPAIWPSGYYSDDTSTKRIVKVLFYQQDHDWKSIESKINDPSVYPSACNWFIAFDGKQIGSLSSKKAPLLFEDSPWTYPRDSYHSTVEKNLPQIGGPDAAFASWSFEKEMRPLVVVSEDHCSDPGQWKPFEPDMADMDLLYPVYAAYALKSSSADTIKKTSLRYLKSYRSENAGQLIQIGWMQEYEDKEYIADPVWIYKSPSGEIWNISKVIDYNFMQDDFGDDDVSVNTMVDAGDYDGDGKSEVIFRSSRYNGDGYVMFFNEFTDMVSFTWSYH